MAADAAGRLAPLATVVLVLVMLFAVLPVYLYLAGRSPHGRGVIGLLAATQRGWTGKVLVLVLLGFAATNFVVAKSFSSADAAVHVIQNPLWREPLARLANSSAAWRSHVPSAILQDVLDYWNLQLVVTVLIALVGFTLLTYLRRGFTRRAIQVAALVTGVYLVLTAVVIGGGLRHLIEHPEIAETWWREATGVSQGTGGGLLAWRHLAAVSLLALPQLALCLAAFELGMIVMPLVRGDESASHDSPRQRIRNTRKMLMTIASILSVYMLGAALVTALLVSPEAQSPQGKAYSRALAYLAHAQGEYDLGLCFGPGFGTAYDVSAVLILGLAGASVLLGLKDLVPRYLLEVGMELEWAHKIGATTQIFNAIILTVTVLFQASVTAQRGALCTSILVLLTAAALAGVKAGKVPQSAESRPWQLQTWLAILGMGFCAAAVVSILINPVGLLIALAFVAATLSASMLSRFIRSTELRFDGFAFYDCESKFLWETVQHLDFQILVPHRPGRRSVDDKEADIRRWHRLAADTPIVFLEVHLGDPSNFTQRPIMQVIPKGGRVTLRVTECVSVAHVIAATALELSKHGSPREIHFGWSDERPMRANLKFVLFGQGNVPWLVRELILRAHSNCEQEPRIVIG
jgi:hypothetical protein